MTKISKIIIRDYKKLKLDKVINLTEVKLAEERLIDINSDFEKRLDKGGSDPSHKVYSLIQNLMSYFAEELSIHNEFTEYYEKVEVVENEYSPSFPPESPLSGSYFTYWAFCDMKFGRNKETINTILTDIGLEFNFDKLIMKGLLNLNLTCMRFYRHLGFENDLIVLKDILTDRTFRCLCISNYKGEKNEIWYIRIAPNLDNVYDYSITLTTPYIIINYSENAWLNFFKRQGIEKKEIDYEKRYSDFMKDNSDYKYWHNYIMDGYVNYRPNCIYLTGIPDIKGSKPHELGNEFM